jgi:hypothetical protein
LLAALDLDDALASGAPGTVPGTGADRLEDTEE